MKITKILMYLIASAALFTSCKGAMDEITSINSSRAFSPTFLTVTLGTFDKATVTWQQIDSARAYVVELSQGDSLQFNNIIATYETESLSQALTGLWGETQYSVRVQAKAFRDGQEDSKWYSVAFTTHAEQIFNTVANADIKTDQIIVRWAPNSEVTNLVVSPDIGNIVLTPDDIAAGMKIITGLTPSTLYTIGIYNDDQKRGTVQVTTKYRPYGPNVVEVSNGDDLNAITSDDANIGKIIYLPEGFTYDVSSATGLLIAGNMTIYGDPDATVKPTITLSSTSGGARVFQLPVSADSVLFTNLTIIGPGASAGTSVLDQDFSKPAEVITYLGAVIFENCDMSDFGRSLIRIRTATTGASIGLVSVNNCLCTNFGNNGGDNGAYAFFTLNTASGGIDNIVVTNSTFQTQYHSFVNAPATSPNTSPAKNVLIQNCTFNDIITGPTATTSRYFIDGNNNTGLTVTINNVILGKAGTGDAATTTASDYRIGDGSTVTVTNSYKTTDHSTVSTADFTGITLYNGASTALWVDPANLNFHFKDTGFAGKATAGDPRWW